MGAAVHYCQTIFRPEDQCLLVGEIVRKIAESLSDIETVPSSESFESRCGMGYQSHAFRYLRDTFRPNDSVSGALNEAFWETDISVEQSETAVTVLICVGTQIYRCLFID
uniref:Uncharacterized protein n=1 Tax=uncultured bacterium fosmid pJB65E1 TaxID=1478066 RepID=A0A0H3U9R2_9BACT|nr:hypothetical protein [uncultured bacterium fosmid pJB65E1]